ncbi:thiamine diphosphokinase [Paracoccus aerodenitrificans]|uniref:thiamine diphosphokinase n=1 Tax=Paracoccus aerodenitrificans TaxID=3017781 RepID=UPI0022F121C4|nr:thiamine diphosphokinase [Paracoccus aerodenitrificans]WBU65401.1 thiamine diphosphokinase [Paracoccus aerodenitrificans]
MSPLPFSTAEGATLIGGGKVTSDDLETALARAPVLVAADGGADAAIALGRVPDLAIGDFDSISEPARAALGPSRLLHIAEQDSTDFAKALGHIKARFVLAIGFSGRRLDHTLAALNVMIRHREPPCLMLAAEDIAFLTPPELSLPLSPGTRVSLFPLGPSRGRSQGLRWPIDGLEFSPGGRVGTSNEATGPVHLTMEGPMLTMLPREALDLALAALTAPMSA